VGWVIDRWAGTSPTWLLVGGIAGIVVGLSTLIRGAMRANREFEEARKDRKP